MRVFFIYFIFIVSCVSSDFSNSDFTRSNYSNVSFFCRCKMASVLFTKLATTIGRDEVYVVAVPLRATKGPAQLVMSAAYSLNLWDLQHFMVLIKPSSPPPSSQVLSLPISQLGCSSVFLQNVLKVITFPGYLSISLHGPLMDILVSKFLLPSRYRNYAAPKLS